MTHSNDIQAVELNIKRAKELIDLGTALDHLRSNRDFKKVIIDGYFSDEAVRLVHLKGDPSMQGESSQTSIIKQMDSIASLYQYFFTIDMRASSAARSVESDEETLSELLAEGV